MNNTYSDSDMTTAPFVREICSLCENLYRLGWDERNGGNISYLIPEKECRPYLQHLQHLQQTSPPRSIPISFDGSALAGKIFLVTGSGKYFKNVAKDPESNLGLIQVAENGKSVHVLWGYADGAVPTSELPAHFMSHTARLQADPQHRIVIHTHTTNIIAMTFVHNLQERDFSRTLWKMCTECIVVFPEGVGVLPWMLCGNDEIGRATAQKMRDFRLVVWSMHGVYGTGKTPDEAFGLIETAEKAAEIYMKIARLPILQTITDQQLKTLADAFGVAPHKDWLDV